MIEGIEIRKSAPDDTPAIEALYPEAFPDEDLLTLVRELLSEASDVTSLVACDGRDLIAHGFFTDCRVTNTPGKVALLGPLAVASTRRGRGIGGTLIRDGLRRMAENQVWRVFVLGDPAFYGRFGFSADKTVTPPYSLPREWRAAWQSVSFDPIEPYRPGLLCVPRPWMQSALWSP